MSERTDRLKDAIELSHHCRAEHVDSTPVTERFGGKIVWEGVVETFELVGHSGMAKRCYAWSSNDNGAKRYTTILELPPVNSPQSAVKAAVASEAKNRLLHEPDPNVRKHELP